MVEGQESPTSEFEDCPCSGKTLNRLIHPAILTVLAQEALHGYAIVRKVSAMPMLGGEKPDPTGVYRCLKSMEEQGLVTSAWDLPDAGPAKRSFALTPDGHRCLCRWVESLEVHREAIEGLLVLARAALEKRSADASHAE
jgi:DNA-binding PadR family transcriptional regulator